MKRIITLLAVAATVAMAGCNRAPVNDDTPAATSTVIQTPFEPVTPGDFTLVDEDGKPFHFSQLRGHPALLFFGYTNCPDACPTMLSKLARVYRLVGAPAKDVPTLFVSVDPRDTPPVLKKYLQYYSMPSIGLTGSKAQIDDAVKRFGASYMIIPHHNDDGFDVSHTTWLYVIDKDGKVVARLDHDSETGEIVEALKKVL